MHGDVEYADLEDIRATEGEMFERFTDNARRAVVEAQVAARDMMHAYIGTEHLLLALASVDSTVARSVLDTHGVTAQIVRDRIVDIVGQGLTAPTGHIPFTPEAKKALEKSLRRALELGDHYIGSEHVLLGVASVEGLAQTILLEHVEQPLRKVLMDEVLAIPGRLPPHKANVNVSVTLTRDEAAALRRVLDMLVHAQDDAEKEQGV